MERLFRFELAFDGKPQNVGFLEGLIDVGLPKKQEHAFYEAFFSLPVPELEEEGIVSFWFTPKGLEKYKQTINGIIQAIAPYGWDLIGSSMESNTEDCIYQDDLQIAFWAGRLGISEDNYMILSNVEDILAQVPLVRGRKGVKT